MGDKSPGIRRPLYKETDIVPNDCCRICTIYVKVSGRSKINFFGYNNKDFSQTFSSVLSAVCQREVVKFARVYQSRLLHCLLLRGAPFASIRGHSLQNSNINMYSGNLARILVLLFLWNNDARKSHAAKQTLNVRNVLSEVFVDPIDLFGWLSVVPSSNPLGIKRFVSGISISVKCECHIIMQMQYTKNLIPARFELGTTLS